MKKLVILATCLTLSIGTIGFLSSCLNTAPSSGSGTTPGVIDKQSLLGSWKATQAIRKSDETTHKVSDVSNATVISLTFFEDECRLYVDTNFSILKWELSGDDITLKGDGTYYLKVQDGGKNLLWEDFGGGGYNLEFSKEEK